MITQVISTLAKWLNPWAAAETPVQSPTTEKTKGVAKATITEPKAPKRAKKPKTLKPANGSTTSTTATTNAGTPNGTNGSATPGNTTQEPQKQQQPQTSTPPSESSNSSNQTHAGSSNAASANATQGAEQQQPQTSTPPSDSGKPLVQPKRLPPTKVKTLQEGRSEFLIASKAIIEGLKTLKKECTSKCVHVTQAILDEWQSVNGDLEASNKAFSELSQTSMDVIAFAKTDPKQEAAVEEFSKEVLKFMVEVPSLLNSIRVDLADISIHNEGTKDHPIFVPVKPLKKQPSIVVANGKFLFTHFQKIAMVASLAILGAQLGAGTELAQSAVKLATENFAHLNLCLNTIWGLGGVIRNCRRGNYEAAFGIGATAAALAAAPYTGVGALREYLKNAGTSPLAQETGKKVMTLASSVFNVTKTFVTALVTG